MPPNCVYSIEKMLTSNTKGSGDCCGIVVDYRTAERKVLDWIPTPLYEPPRGKTNNLHMRKQRRRSASR